MFFFSNCNFARIKRDIFPESHLLGFILCCQISANLWHHSTVSGISFFFSAPSSSSSDSSGPGHCLCGPRASDCGFWCLFPGQSTSGSHGKGDFTAWPPGPLAKQQQRFPVKRAWEPVERWTPLPCPAGCWPEQLTTLSFNYIRPTQNPHLWSTVRLCFKPLVPDQLMAFIDTIFL